MDLAYKKKAFIITQYFSLSWLTLVFLLLFFYSLTSGMYYDQGFMTYVAYLINEHDFVPYRDIFEFNMPVSYLFHMAMGKLLGYTDIAFRITHVMVLAILLGIMWLLQRPQGRIYAFASCIIFGIFYMGRGGALLLQRDMLGIIPIGIAVLINYRLQFNNRENLQYTLTGLLFAISFLIKPHMIIGLPVLMMYQFARGESPVSLSKKTIISKLWPLCLFTLLGFSVPVLMAVIWLWSIDALPSFLELFTSFVPVYGKISAGLTPIEEGGKLEFLIRHLTHYLSLQYGNLLLLAIFGIYLLHAGLKERSKKIFLYFLIALTLAYIVYVAVGGKFWDYHWLPFQYFVSMSVVYCLFSTDYQSNFNGKHVMQLALLLSFLFVFTIKPAYKSYTQFGHDPAPLEGKDIEIEAYYSTIEEMKSYLGRHMKADDTVQPLDWIVGGVVHGMLELKAVPATRHITDFQFYFDIKNPYIQQLRVDFIDQLERKKPKFIIKSYTCELILEKYTHGDFPELEKLIEEHYTLARGNEYFNIFIRNP